MEIVAIIASYRRYIVQKLFYFGMIKQDKGKIKNWADEEEEDLDENETKLDSSGVKERVKISVNAKGQKVDIELLTFI